MAVRYKTTLIPLTVENAEPKARELLESARRTLGFIPNMYGNMANEPGLLATYLSGYAAFREGTGFTPAEQEVVFLTISRENRCTYCVAAHSVIADTMSKVPAAVTDAIRDGKPIPDPKFAALAAFTKVMLNSRGMPTAGEVDQFLAAGYSERQVLSIILAIAVKTLSNYANHVFHTPVDGMFAARAWDAD